MKIVCALSVPSSRSRFPLSFCCDWPAPPVPRQALLWLGGGTGGEEPSEATVQVCIGYRRRGELKKNIFPGDFVGSHADNRFRESLLETRKTALSNVSSSRVEASNTQPPAPHPSCCSCSIDNFKTQENRERYRREPGRCNQTYGMDAVHSRARRSKRQVDSVLDNTSPIFAAIGGAGVEKWPYFIERGTKKHRSRAPRLSFSPSSPVEEGERKR